MKKIASLLMLLLWFAWVGSAFATLTPSPAASVISASYMAASDGACPAQQFCTIGAAPTFLNPTDIQFTPDNIQAVIFSAATPHPVCYTLTGADPTPSSHGTCPAGASTFTYGTSTPLHIDGNVTLKYISTSSTDNSAVVTSTVTIAPFGVYAGGTYGYTPTVVFSGTYLGNLIYTTNGTTPTASGSCTATNGTAAANGTTLTPTNGEVVKVIGCLSGATTGVSTATYTIRSPLTWYIRADGGGLYSASRVSAGFTGQAIGCNGTTDAAYPGSGTNQNCGLNDVRYMWDDDTGVTHFPVPVWQGFGGGDTLIIEGCTALAGQTSPANPNCRIGWDQATGNGPTNNWCYYNNNLAEGCFNPTFPPGNSSNHTRILGKNYASCNVGTNPKTYAATLAQLFGGFNVQYDLNLAGARYADVECIELTAHNGTCATYGYPQYPAGCSSNQPFSDFARGGVLTDYNTSNVTLQDVYIHGTTGSGISGPIGGAITVNRVFIGFNAFSGWNFDDGNSTPDAPGSQILASYVTMIGNGCYEQYPLSNAFPALACYDTNSGGFGDTFSGQDTILDTLNCDHCVTEYNTKDGWIGPHTLVTNQAITNSTWIGNMGTQFKNGVNVGGSFNFQNNLVVGNCNRMSTTIPGAAQNFSQGTSLNGSYLTGYCRAGGATFALSTSPGATTHVYGNTIVGAWDTVFQYDCGPEPGGLSTCGSVPLLFTDNNFIGYTDPIASGSAPGLYYALASGLTFTGSYNNEYGIRNGDTCGVNHITCVDPLLVNEPAQTWPGSEAALDVFNPATTGFYPTSGSPLRGAGIAIGGLTADYYGVTRPNPPGMGGVEYVGAVGGIVNTGIISMSGRVQ